VISNTTPKTTTRFDLKARPKDDQREDFFGDQKYDLETTFDTCLELTDKVIPKSLTMLIISSLFNTFPAKYPIKVE